MLDQTNSPLGFEWKFGYTLRKIRKERSMSLDNMAELLGVSKGSVSAYENAVAIPSLEKACEFAHKLGVSVDYLVGRDDESSFRIKSLADIADTIIRLDAFKGIDLQVDSSSASKLVISDSNLVFYFQTRQELAQMMAEEKQLAGEVPSSPKKRNTYRSELRDHLIELALYELSSKDAILKASSAKATEPTAEEAQPE